MSAPRVAAAGVVTPAGFGVRPFLAALQGSGFAHRTERSRGWGYRVSAVAELGDLAAVHLDGLDTRRMDRVGVLALLATRNALQSAGLTPPLGPATALVLVSTHGAIGFSTQYHEGVVRRGAKGLSALLFSASLLSSAAGTVALAFGIRGPVHTLTAGATAAADALELAALLLEAGDAERVLVVGAEMFDPVYVDAYDALFALHARFGRSAEADETFSFSEGATALVLDHGERGGLGRLLGASGTLAGGGWTQPLASRLEGAWSRAGITPATADLFLTGANRTFVDRLESEALAEARGGRPRGDVLALKRRTGEGFAHTAVLQAAAALLGLRPDDRALVQGVHFDGAAGAVALGGATP